MSEGFIQITRELLNHPSVIAAPVAQRWVLITLIERCAFRPIQMDDHGVIIDLEPGQIMCTYREHAEYVKVEKNDVERAILRFERVKILRREVRHKKSIFTIMWGIEFGNSETKTETKVRQERDTNEERKNETPSFKKETNKERKIVRPLFRSSLLHEEDLEAMVALTEFKNRLVPLSDFSLWIKKYELVEISWVCEKMLSQKTIKNSPAASMQWLLTDRAYHKHINIEKNKSFAEELKKSYRLNSLVITQKYARDETSGYDFQFNWDVEMFERVICEKFNIDKSKSG